MENKLPETDTLKLLEVQAMEFQNLCSEVKDLIQKNEVQRG